MHRPIRILLLTSCFSIIFLISTACVPLIDPESTQEYRAHTVWTLTQGQTIGQTFVSRRSPFNGIQLWLKLDQETAPSSGLLTAELYYSPEDSTPIASVRYSFQSLVNQSTIIIPFDIRSDPPGQAYYLKLSTNGGNIDFHGRNEDAYPLGYAYHNEQPLNADLSFRLSYKYTHKAVMDDINNITSDVFILIPIFLLLWLPGRILLSLLDTVNFDALQRFSISIGLSMGIIPVVMLWTSNLGISWNRNVTWLLFLTLALLYTWLNRKQILTFIQSPKITLPRNWLIYACMACVYISVIFVRVAMVRDYSAPAWVDSVHHATIAQLIIDQGGLPKSYSPLIDIATASYHSGFHSLVAIYHWLSGLEIKQALLTFGQVLNSLMVFGVYLLTFQFTKNRWAGVIAALISGLFTPMPAYYTSWGRYTQLAGLLILPTAFVLAVTTTRLRRIFSQKPIVNRRTIIRIFITSIALGGLFLTHYRVTAFLALLLIIAISFQSVKDYFKERNLRLIFNRFLFLGTIVILAIMITLPWWPNTLSSLFSPNIGIVETKVPLFHDFNWAYLNTALGIPATILAIMGIILGIIKRRGFVLVIILWTVFLFFTANLGTIPLPGAGFINNTSVEIMLFLPISLLAGYFIVEVGQWPEKHLTRFWRIGYHVALAITLFAAIWIGARTLIPILNPATTLYRDADNPAIEWISKNVNEDETFLINPFSWGYGLYAGNDGGYWITPLAKRATMPPPVLYALDFSSETTIQTNQINQYIIQNSANLAELHRYLLEQRIDYIYIGARGGILSPSALEQSPLFTSIYSDQGVWIFRVKTTQ